MSQKSWIKSYKSLYKLLCLFAIILFVFSKTSFSNDKHVNVITIKGGINAASSEFINMSILNSEKDGAQCLIINLDTPGGTLVATREIVQGILNSTIPVVVYVSPSGAHAGSAGTFITLSGNIAAMAPGTNIGAAHPIMMTGKDIAPDEEEEKNKKNNKDKKKDKDIFSKDKEKKKSDSQHLSEKVVNDTAAFIETIAQHRGRNVQWAIKAVRESVSITEKKALELKVIDLIAEDIHDLLKKIDGKTVKVKNGKKVLHTKGSSIKNFYMNWKQKFIDILSTPDIVYILMGLGMLGLYMEFSHPGAIFPGVVGGICLILAFVSFQILPFNYAALLLLLLSVILFIAEIYTTTFGLLTLGGIICFVIGSLLLFDAPGMDLHISRDLIVGVTLAISLFTLFCAFVITKAYKNKTKTGKEGLLNEIAEVTYKIDKKGKVFYKGEYWNAESEEIIEQGEKVKIVEVNDMILKVKKIT